MCAFGQKDYEYLLEFPIEVIILKLLYAKLNPNNLRAQLKNTFLREYSKWGSIMVCISYAFGSTNILENFHVPNDGGYHTEKKIAQLLLKKKCASYAKACIVKSDSSCSLAQMLLSYNLLE